MTMGEIPPEDTTQHSIPAFTPANYDYAPDTYIHVVSNLDDSVTDEQAISIASERWHIQREQVLGLPTDEEGLNMARVNEFCESLDMAPKAVCVLAPDDYERALGIAEAVPTNEDGLFLPRLDLIIVRRDPVKEELNGTDYTESVIVHERAHADVETISVGLDVRPTPSSVRARIPAAVTPNDERVGAMVSTSSGETRGSYIEEGRPEVVRGRYVIDILHKPHGFVGEQGSHHPQIDDKYLFLNRTASGEIAADAYEGALPAMGLEQLMEHDQGLWDSLWRARKSLEGLRGVAQRLNGIVPGLYDTVQAIDVGTADGQLQAATLLIELAQGPLTIPASRHNANPEE